MVERRIPVPKVRSSILLFLIHIFTKTDYFLDQLFVIPNMDRGERRRILIEDSFFDEGYQERLNNFKTVTVVSNTLVDNHPTNEFRCSVYRCNQSFLSMAKVV